MGDNLTWRENRCIKTGRLHHSFLHATSDTQEIAMNGKAWKGRQSLKHAFWPAEELLAMTASSTQATWLGQWLHPPSNAMQCPTVIPGSGRSPGEGNGNPPQYSCLENPMDRGAWRLQSMGSQKSQRRLKRLSTSTQRGFMQTVWSIQSYYFFWSETLITISNSESDKHLTPKYLLAHTLLINYVSARN